MDKTLKSKLSILLTVFGVLLLYVCVGTAVSCTLAENDDVQKISAPEETESPEIRYAGKTIVGAEVIPEGAPIQSL